MLWRETEYVMETICSCRALGFPLDPAVLAFNALKHPLRDAHPQSDSPNMLWRNAKFPRQRAVVEPAALNSADLPLCRAKMGVQIETSNIREEYTARMFPSREICMPRPQKMRSSQAERIFQLRKSLKLDQQAFAKRLDVKQATVSRWESGEITPSRRTYLDLAKLAAPHSDVQKQLIIDGGFEQVARRMRDVNDDRPEPRPRWDPELLAVVMEALTKKFSVTTGTLSGREFAEKVVFYYELCHKMKTEDPGMVEKFLMTA
jgi:DNA-binding transcriptional regulator YiaG